MIRRFVDAPNDDRCQADIRLRDGSGAQCGRRRQVGDTQYCSQHRRIRERTDRGANPQEPQA